jgi:SHS2 domain-containing protein
MTFEYLDHPADIGFRARSASLEGLFANAAHALVNLILDPATIRPDNGYPLSAGAGDIESLLVNFLNEVLYLVDGRRLALSAFEITHLTDTQIECLARGEPRDPVRHPARLVVKAVTYHQLKVARTDDGWLAEVYVDI